ncbi:MAG: hypothetical protein ACTSV6_06680, partial [Candidatus Heimdallarchaeota archaeon]
MVLTSSILRIYPFSANNINMRPFINVEADSLPEAYEKLYVRVGEEGKWSKKESYVEGKEFDEILECESRVAISNALREPMLSSAFPSYKSLPEYVGDVLLGLKDDQIGTTYDYTYHERIFPRSLGPGGQLTYVIKKLAEAPYTNRAQITTWRPEVEPSLKGPPCFQRGWFKIEDGTLNFETDWRS